MCLPFLQQSSRRASRLSDIVHIYVVPAVAKNSKAERRRQFYTQLLDHVKSVSGALSTIADGPVNVPSLKTVADLINKVAELGQVSSPGMTGSLSPRRSWQGFISS